MKKNGPSIGPQFSRETRRKQVRAIPAVRKHQGLPDTKSALTCSKLARDYWYRLILSSMKN